MLFFDGFIGLLLLLLVLCLSPDTDGLEHETLHLEHVERVVLLNSDLVLSDVLKQLLEERIVRVFDQVKQIVFDHFQKFLIAFIDSAVINYDLGRLNNFLDIFECFGSILAWFSSLIL